MIIGFLGKGGSGKSTLSTLFVHYLATKGKVLALDADHNMDLTYNLVGDQKFPYLGEGLSEIKSYAGIKIDAETSAAFFLPEDPTFTLSPPDSFTQKFSKKVSDQISLMSGGPHTDKVLYGQSCSHILTTALKIYLPFLALKPGEFAVLDEKAGSDGAGTGIVTGLTMAIVCTEPTPHGTKAANQIAELLDFHNVPYEFAINKIKPVDDISGIQGKLKKPAKFFFEHNEGVVRPNSEIPEKIQKSLDEIMEHANQLIKKSGDKRKERSREKYRKAISFKNS